MKKYLSIVLCLLLAASLLAGCGSSANTSAASYDMEYAVESPAVMDAAQGAALKNSAADTGSTTLPESRKWIITVNLTAETDDLDALQTVLDEKIAALQGYVEDQSVYNGSAYQSGRRYRSASLTIRIPADQVDAFLQDMGGIANIVRQNKSIEDVTLSYTATENRLKALETEETRLLELLAQAETMSDLLEIEARLSEVRYELENYASQKRLYDNQIDYATIYLSIEEVQEYTPVEEPTLWERIRDGFKDNLEDVGEGLLDVLVWFIVSIPTLVVLAAVVLIVVLVVKRIRRRRAVKKAAKQKKAEE
ncbi:MAG: DUF4349 domain-containing protein [Eubacteriales bacterium]|nr:DUF4349 domain-containing protein [Eubacteriales bacterium]